MNARRWTLGLAGLTVLAMACAGSPTPGGTVGTAPSTPPAARVVTTGPSPAVPTFGDGTYEVGTDVPAGTYKTYDNVGADCYWSITKTGSNGQDIISNDIPGGGRPTITLKAGQTVNSARCGTWGKIR